MPETAAPDPTPLAADPAALEPATELQGDAELQAEPELQADAETFPREYVAELRRENATYRERARDAAARADALAAELWHERVAALGMFADPADLPFDPEALADPAALRAAAETLLAEKPHLRSRRITTRVGQGERNGSPPVSLLGMLRGGL